MKTFFYFIFIALFSFPSFSQSDKSEKKAISYDQFPVSVLYGTKLLQNQYFNGQLNSYNNFKINNSISFIGLCLSMRLTNATRGHAYEPHIYYSQVLPAKININDSIKANLKGFQCGAGLLGFDLLRKQKNFSLSIMLGFNTGRVKLYGDKSILQTNTFFSPKLSVKPMVYFWRLSLGALIDYEYDISKGAWKSSRNEGSEQLQLDKLSQTGITAQLNLGYLIKYRSAKGKKIAKNNKKKRKKKK